MNTYLLHFTMIVAILASGSCTSGNPVMTETAKSPVSDIRQMFDNYYKDVSKSGLTAELKYLDSSGDFFWVPPGYDHVLSYDSVVRILKTHAPRLRHVDNTMDSLRIVPLSPTLAAYTAKLHSSSTDTSGKTTDTNLIETGIVIRRTDGWKLLSGQTSVTKD